jgi:nitroreductase
MKNCIDAINERRSIKFFDSERSIKKDTLKEILTLANTAPSSINLQPWEVIVVESSEKKKVLRKCAQNQAKVEEASANLVIIANPKALEENMDRTLDSWMKLGNITESAKDIYKSMANKLYSDDYTSQQRALFAVKNTSFFAMSIMIIAKFFGLDTHPMDGFDEVEIKKAFNIESYKIIPLIIAIGYKSENFQLSERAFRRPLEEFVKFL